MDDEKEKKLSEEEEMELCLNCPLPECVNCLARSRTGELWAYRIAVKKHLKKLKEQQERKEDG